YGLAGLRIGWAVAAPDMSAALWRRHEYAVITAAAPSMTLAAIALEGAKRRQLLDRQRAITRQGFKVLEGWLPAQEGRFSWHANDATSIAFVRLHLPVSSFAFAERVRQDASVLIAPGSALGAEDYLRITVGYEPGKVQAALDRIGMVAARLGAAQRV
ncbi:MAG TPA: aminotransferase class I/II-fold pyridoxal phosphate-dependent enzyme, partial [Roseiflexaceae bacterium]|nr:aminotransferase class I/II-fold pyridoxal phosphate-dependent enzyme [Roseiflexaceae bacterium]